MNNFISIQKTEEPEGIKLTFLEWLSYIKKSNKKSKKIAAQTFIEGYDNLNEK